MKITSTIFLSTLILFCALNAAAQKTVEIESVYTNLDAKSCKTLESSTEDAGWYLGECRGIGDYKLQVSEGDIRQSINVVAPDKKIYALDFQRNVSGAFSYVGAKAEWRVKRKGETVAPLALIVRFNASENAEDATKNTSYLIVSKITNEGICVTNVVKSGANANEEARRLADASATAPCKTSDN